MSEADTIKNEEEVILDQENAKEEESSTDLSRLAQVEAELKDLQSKYLYALAETDNIKKRNIKERSELVKYQGESIVRDLLEILDDLERVGSVGPETNTETILEGIQLIGNRMRSIFERYSIKGEISAGTKFDPNKHEALSMVDSSEIEAGTIIQEIKKCYHYKDKLLRPAQVVVSNGGNNKEK